MASKTTPAKKSPAEATGAPTSDLPELSAEQRDQLAALDFIIPEYRPLSNGEVGGLSIEALEGYAYGERTRYDTQGRRWEFVREALNDQFRLTIRCSIGQVKLTEGAMPLDRVAGKEGEEALIGLVAQLVEEAAGMSAACRREQQALKVEKPPAVLPQTEAAGV